MSLISASPGAKAFVAERAPIANPYGRFSADGREFRIINPRTPRPWSNIIANPRMGMAVSQSGSGFTWIDNSQLAVITRWNQEFATDSSGKFIYLRDADSGELWSAAPAPVWADGAKHECQHGLGYSRFLTDHQGIQSNWTLLVHATQTIELWKLELKNATGKARRIEVCPALEWNCGVSPSPRREFHKLFVETSYDPALRAILGWNHMWDVPNSNFGHWNTPFPYHSALASSDAITDTQGDKTAFLGRNGDWSHPSALGESNWPSRFGRHEDPIAAMRIVKEIPPGESRTLVFALAVGPTQSEVIALVRHWCGGGERSCALRVDQALEEVREGWHQRLADHRVETPDETLNSVVNDWVRYQAISGRIWGRCGYYQQSGAFGFRDQLQDSQVWLTIEPKRCREQINHHAAHQFADGSVYHWWHPLSEQGHITRMTDDLLWLAFVTANYIKETGDFAILSDRAPFLDDPDSRPLLDHIVRAFTRVFSRMSPRGLPYIGAGDWNDGLSACGLQERGESIWLGQFLAGLLGDWAALLQRVQGSGFRVQGIECGAIASEYADRRTKLAAAINEHGWDGDWYWRATLDDGSIIGSRHNRVGKIFLNAQTWAILNDVAPPDRAKRCWEAVKGHLVSSAGALLLAPAFDVPDERIGYITRYAPGLRENGGVYTHAATWAIAAACKMNDQETLAKLLSAINPANKDPESYWAEPYVLPGNVDGPQSPYFGRAGWTWYTGSAQWLHRVVSQSVFGVQPEFDGLRIQPCWPKSWNRARMVRPWRGARLDIHFDGSPSSSGSRVELSVDGHNLPDNLIAANGVSAGSHQVRVKFNS